MLDAGTYDAPPPGERAAVAGMCSVAVLLVAALASLGAAAAQPDWWKVVLLLPWYLVQGLVVVGGAVTGLV